MKDIEVKTGLRHRFGKSINIKGSTFNIDSKGITKVPEEIVPYALKEGFELVDPSVKFSSLEKQEQAQEISNLLESAKKQAQEIIESAKGEAERILIEARRQAGMLLEDAHVDEKQETRDLLSKKTVKELQEMAIVGGISEDKYKNLKKDDLIELLVESSFGKE